MKHIVLAVIFVCGPFFVFSQAVLSRLQHDNIDYNLSFENDISGIRSPAYWQTGKTKSGYRVDIDSVQKHTGKYSLLIENIEKNVEANSGMSKIVIPAQYAGKEVEVRFYLKLEQVKEYASFVLRIDDEDNDPIQFTNLPAKKISGTKDWKQYSLKLPLLEDAAKINLFPALYGPGKLWIDDVQVLFDGVDIGEAKIRPDYNFKPYKPIDYGNNSAASGTVKVRDAELYYEIYGKGDPLLLLHGNSQSIKVFKKQIKELSKSFKVVAVDSRGQGRSTDRIAEPLSYDLYAEDMKTLLDSLHITHANVLGWSDGGNTGLIMAAKYPGYVKKLAVTGACTNPNDAVSAGTLREVASAIKNLKSKSDERSAYQVKLFTMLLTEPHISTQDLNDITAPVLVMAGEKDMILEGHTKYIAASIRNSSLFIFKDASHDVPVEKPSEFNSKVFAFLVGKR